MNQHMRGPALAMLFLVMAAPPGWSQSTIPNAIPTVAIPEPAPKAATPPAAAQGRGASTPPAADPAAAPITGIKVVNFSSEYYIGGGAGIVGNQADHVWAAKDGNLPQSFVLELPTEAVISYLVINNQAFGDPKGASKDIEISVSPLGAAFGFGPPVKAVLERGEIGQAIMLQPPLKGRWVKLRILSNHGRMDSTTLGIVQVIGRPVTP